MLCEVCKKDKVILVTRMKMSDEEEARDVYICEECLTKQKKQVKGKKKS
jgi:protein-arginine kinase activator protein McsA